MPGCLGAPVVNCSYAFFHCVRGCGCGEHPAFPAPSSVEGKLIASGATAPRECYFVAHPSRRIAKAMLLRMRPEHAVQDPHGEEAPCAVSNHEAGKLLSSVARGDGPTGCLTFVQKNSGRAPHFVNAPVRAQHAPLKIARARFRSCRRPGTCIRAAVPQPSPSAAYRQS
jgi:hypothetical protein